MYLPSQWLTNTKKKKNILTSDHAIVLQKKKRVAIWEMAASIISSGLSFRQALPIIALGFTIVS